MPGVLVTRSGRVAVIAFLVILAAIGGLVYLLVFELGSPEGISVTTQGSAVVGSDFRFLIRVRAPSLPQSGGVYLSLEGLEGSFEMSPAEALGHPWGRANVWNLSGLDLSLGRTFILDATPTWAAEIPLRAAVWFPRDGFGSVRFVNGDSVDLATASIGYSTPLRVTTTWPLAASMTPVSPLVAGRATALDVSVHVSSAAWSTAQPLFLSVVTKAMYYTLSANGTSENPWGARILWNLTGADLARGIHVSVNATPMMADKGLGMDVIVWSPRGDPSVVQLDSSGTIVTPDAVRLWVDTTFTFWPTGA